MAVSPPPKYHYDPSLAAAVIFAVLFGISAVWHAFQLVHTKTWYFIAFLIGVLCKFHYISRNTVRVLTQCYSWGGRVFIASGKCGRDPELVNSSLYNPDSPSFVSTSPLRSFDIHGTWSDYESFGSWPFVSNLNKMANQSICFGRHSIICYSVYWYVRVLCVGRTLFQSNSNRWRHPVWSQF